MQTKDQSVIDRRQASRILGVSVRTIDRYIRGGRIPAYSKSGRVLLKKKDVAEFNREESSIEPIVTSRPMRQAGTVHPDRMASTTIPVHVSTPQARPQNDFYKDLYDESKKILNDYHQKLEQANYKIGQLEHAANTGANSVIGFTRTPLSLRDGDSVAFDLLKKEVSDKEKEISALKNTLSEEQSARTIFAILTYVLLASIPLLWFLMRG